MVVDKSYKISAFGYFGDIVPNSDNMMFFLETFKNDGLIPSLIQELNVTGVIPGTNPVPTNRIALMSNDGQTQVVIGTNRIDYSFSVQDDRKLVQEQLVSINERISCFFKTIFVRFNKKANRLALNTESLIVNLNNEEVGAFMQKYGNPISLYTGVLDEWNVHLMIRKNVEISKNESLNVITNISKATITKTLNDESQISDGFIVQTDINTVAENNELRFDRESLVAFIKESNELWNLIISEMG